MVLFALISGFLSILGLASAVEWLISTLNGRGCACGRVTLLPVTRGDDELEIKLRCAYNSMRWDRWITGGQLVLVDIDADEAAHIICETFAAGRPDVHLRTREEIAALAGRPEVYKTLYSVLY